MFLGNSLWFCDCFLNLSVNCIHLQVPNLWVGGRTFESYTEYESKYLLTLVYILLGDCSTPSKKQKKKTEGNKGQDKGKKAKKKQIEGTHCGDEAKVRQAFAY